MPRICLNSIVKNEMANLPRMLDSVAPHISCYAILDTGSMDGSQEFIREYFKKRSIPGCVVNGNFINFSQARNLALDVAKEFDFDYDYLLLMDADMELVVDGPLPQLVLPAYALTQRHGELVYHNTRLLRSNAGARYVGVTHEFLSHDGGCGIVQEWWFKDHASGSNRYNKIPRDIRLLTADLKKHPDNARTWFYLGNTYRDAGKFTDAIKCYDKRIELGGWDEEVWCAQLYKARCYRDVGNVDKFVTNALKAFQMRQSRAEPLHDLALFHRLRGENALGWMFADAGSKILFPSDQLFVEGGCYTYGFHEEKSITGYYCEHTRYEGFEECDNLSLSKLVPATVREQARNNLAHYLRPLGDHAASFRMRLVPDTLGFDKYYSANPSITVHRRKLIVNVREVNYVIQDDGSYDMQGDTAIRTRNYLMPLTDDLEPDGEGVYLVRPWELPPPEYDQVLGFEDIRLVSSKTKLFGSATMREQNAAGACEQWLTEIDPVTGSMSCPQRLRTPSKFGFQHEKNWMPVPDEGIRFMYRPGVLIDTQSNIVFENMSSLDVGHFSGGSQLVFYNGGWVGVIHEARMDPAFNYTKRYYQHRFVWYDQNFALQKVSKPFCFQARQIEFCAGLAKHPRKNEFVLSFSLNDKTAWFGTIHDHDLTDMIWHG